MVRFWNEKTAVLLLFAAFTLHLAIYFLSSAFNFGFDVFCYLIIPLALAPAFAAKDVRWSAGGISISNAIQTLRCALVPGFAAAAVFLLAILYFSYRFPEPNSVVITRGGLIVVLICMFMLVAARLQTDFEDFWLRFFLVLSPIVALNVLVNFIHLYSSVPGFQALLHVRMKPDFGIATGFWITRGSLTYALFFVASVLLAFNTQNKLFRAILLVSSLVLLGGVLLTQSRSALIATVSAFLLLGVLTRRREYRYMIAGALVLLVVVFAASPALRAGILLRADPYRMEIWSTYLDFVLKQPFIGVGQIVNSAITLKNGEPIEHPHNLLLSAQLLGGAVATLALALVFVFGFLASYKYLRNFHNAVPLCMLTMVFVAGMFDYELLLKGNAWYWTTFWLPFGLTMGCAVANRELALKQAAGKP